MGFVDQARAALLSVNAYNVMRNGFKFFNRMISAIYKYHIQKKKHSCIARVYCFFKAKKKLSSSTVGRI